MNNAEVQPSLSAQATATRPVRDIPSMLLPIEGRQLLVPGVSVAEIVNYSYPECPDNAPEWFLGYVEWRKLSVPLLSFELLNGQTMPRAAVAPRIAVINNTGVDESVPFIAIVIQSIPRLVRVLPQDIKEATDITLAPAELAAMNLAGSETVLVPNFSVLERVYSQYINAR